MESSSQLSHCYPSFLKVSRFSRSRTNFFIATDWKMLGFMLLLALCQVAHPATNYEIATAPIVHVVVEMKHTKDKELEDLYGNVEKMFHKYGETYDIHFNRRNLQREKDFDSHGLYRAKYGLIGVNCLELQDYFLDLDTDTYPVDTVHVNCGQFSFSVCMTNSCPKDTFPNFVKEVDE